MNFNILIALIAIALIAAYIFNRQKGAPVATQTKLVSERLQACEAKGGKYSLIWSEYRNDYLESCQTVSQDIADF